MPRGGHVSRAGQALPSMLTELLLTIGGPLPERGERALDRLPAGHVPARLLRQSHQPPRHDPDLVGPAARRSAG